MTVGIYKVGIKIKIDKYLRIERVFSYCLLLEKKGKAGRIPIFLLFSS
jgi:hypothetical protein